MFFPLSIFPHACFATQSLSKKHHCQKLKTKNSKPQACFLLHKEYRSCRASSLNIHGARKLTHGQEVVHLGRAKTLTDKMMTLKMLYSHSQPWLKSSITSSVHCYLYLVMTLKMLYSHSQLWLKSSITSSVHYCLSSDKEDIMRIFRLNLMVFIRFTGVSKLQVVTQF